MKKPIIGVDVDDVLSEYYRTVVEFANQHWQANMTMDDVNENWSEMFGIDEAEWTRRFTEFCESQSLEDLQPIAGAREVLVKLKAKYDLMVVTSRPKELINVTRQWLAQHFPDTFSDIVFAGVWDDWGDDNVGLHTAAKRTKATICQDLGVDYLIDDQPKHVNGVAACGIKGVLFGDYGWSRDSEIENSVIRAADWEEVASYFGV